MHGLLWTENSETELKSELLAAFPRVTVSTLQAMVMADFPLAAGQVLPHLAFVRQFLPDARLLQAESIRAWANHLAQVTIGRLPDDQPWALHIAPHYGAGKRHRIGARAWHSLRRAGVDTRPMESPAAPSPEADAGRHRARLIREVFLEHLRKHRRQLLRQLRKEPVPFAGVDSVVQLMLVTPSEGVLSVALAPVPHEQRHLVSAFPKGEIEPAQDKMAPSRAFAKLVESEQRLGRVIRAGETCVDLGAAPGSWTYVAVNRGARVIAVDRAPLRADLATQVSCQKADAFSYEPPEPVDWLLCDVIAAPDRTAELLFQWLRRGWCRNFVVTLKSGDTMPPHALQEVACRLSPMCQELRINRLCANKKEVCVFGSAVA